MRPLFEPFPWMITHYNLSSSGDWVTVGHALMIVCVKAKGTWRHYNMCRLKIERYFRPQKCAHGVGSDTWMAAARSATLGNVAHAVCPRMCALTWPLETFSANSACPDSSAFETIVAVVFPSSPSACKDSQEKPAFAIAKRRLVTFRGEIRSTGYGHLPAWGFW